MKSFPQQSTKVKTGKANNCMSVQISMNMVFYSYLISAAHQHWLVFFKDISLYDEMKCKMKPCFQT